MTTLYFRMRIIPLTQGLEARVSDEDYEFLSLFKWYARKSSSQYIHAVTTIWDKEAKKILKVRLHHMIAGYPGKGFVVDHIDGDTLNNCRDNLRLCTPSQNQQNSKPRRGSSRFKGVSWCSAKRKWKSAFRWNGEHYYVGSFDAETDAAIAYNEMVERICGPYARLNQVPEKVPENW